MKQLVISGSLPGLNEYISAERKNRYLAAKMKSQTQHVVTLSAKKCLKGALREPVWMNYRWYEKDRRRDKDNVSAYGRKVIQDGLVKAGALKNDGWASIEGFTDRFYVDKKTPRVEVDILEVGEW